MTLQNLTWNTIMAHFVTREYNSHVFEENPIWPYTTITWLVNNNPKLLIVINGALEGMERQRVQIYRT
jgi:hypothetical protein